VSRGLRCPGGRLPPATLPLRQRHDVRRLLRPPAPRRRPGGDRRGADAVPLLDHVFRTWHPRTRPEDLTPDPGLTWTRLDILGTAAGGEDDEEGEVEFEAHYRTSNGPGVLHERSRFARRAGRWVYVDGQATTGHA
jgi:SEC-C motif-containing protein